MLIINVYRVLILWGGGCICKGEKTCKENYDMSGNDAPACAANYAYDSTKADIKFSIYESYFQIVSTP